MKTLLWMSLVFLIGCGQGKSKLHKIPEPALQNYVNQKSMPLHPNLTVDKSITNNSYPIQIALYEDGRFYYDLPNLGDGHGTWKTSDGVIKLKAKRTLFDMYIEVLANDETGSSLSITFTDRYGPNTLQMMNVNI
jgi:hypothetical protein